MTDQKELRERYLPQRPDVYPQIYAFRLKLEPEELKVGYTTKQNVRDRIEDILGTANLDYTLEYVGDAVTEDGQFFMDHPVHKWLEDHGAIRVPKKDVFKVKGSRLPEIFKNCTVDMVRAAVKSIQTGHDVSIERDRKYGPREEQADAIDKTISSFKRQQNENPKVTPKFLWNAKMRFGKTYTALKMAKDMDLKKILIMSFKVEVKDSWRKEVQKHVEFDGWQWIDIKEHKDGENYDKFMPVVAFGSFQDLLGKNQFGGLKSKNEWVSTIQWDLIIIDEYHYGAWNQRSKNLIDTGEISEQDRLKQEAEDGVEDLSMPEMPITTNYILYLSGTPFRAMTHGEFDDFQLYNWTYSDEQRKKKNVQKKIDDGEIKGENPYAAMPESTKK